MSDLNPSLINSSKQMSDSPSVLGFLIDSPMMSWGTSSRFNQRETEAYPSKSALIGMIAAAMGIDKHSADENVEIVRLSKLRLTVMRLERHPGRFPQRLSDFHTIGGGYDSKASLFDRLSVPRKASGGASANAVITRRSYLTEALFIALWEGSSETLESIQAALLDPVWGVWFGRKTCIPASPLSPVIAPSPREALATLLQKLGRDTAEMESLEGVTEEDGPGTWFQADQPVAFGRHHGAVPEPYHSRPVRRLLAADLT
jgi:CRISPR system Cascade subunit CasD